MKPFGERLYDEIREQGLHFFITQRLDYAEIQELKAADRDEVAKMFRGSGYEIVQRLKTDEPEEFARFLAAEAEKSQQAAAVVAAIMIMGMAIT